MSTKSSPFNGKWVLSYSSDFEEYMDAYEMDEKNRKVVREALKDFSGQYNEEYFVDSDAGVISRKVIYHNEPVREQSNVKFNTMHTGKHFDGRQVKYMYGREADSDNMMVRFEIGNDSKVHTMIVTEVDGDTMIRTYNCRGKSYQKKFNKIA